MTSEAFAPRQNAPELTRRLRFDSEGAENETSHGVGWTRLIGSNEEGALR